MEEAPAAEMSVGGDSTLADGYRVVRLSYRVPGNRMIDAGRAGGSGTAEYAEEPIVPPVDVYVSFVFDPEGARIAMHTDRPWP